VTAPPFVAYKLRQQGLKPRSRQLDDSRAQKKMKSQRFFFLLIHNLFSVAATRDATNSRFASGNGTVHCVLTILVTNDDENLGL
jgi:hypothetical protein